MSLLEDKQGLRRAARSGRESLAEAERGRRSREACARLTALPEMAKARTVAGFVAVKGEIDPAAALQAAWRDGKTVVLPRVTKGVPRLRFHDTRADAALRKAAFGLSEPDAAWPEVAPEALDLVILPGLAFDAAGRRLGWGGGYYDEIARRVRAAGRGVLVGFGFDIQVVDEVPAGPDDVSLDCVVTDARVLRCRAGGPGGKTAGAGAGASGAGGAS